MEGYGKTWLKFYQLCFFRKTKGCVYVYIAQPTLINNSDKKNICSFFQSFSSGTAQQGIILLVASHHPARLATGVTIVSTIDVQI